MTDFVSQLKQWYGRVHGNTQTQHNDIHAQHISPHDRTFSWLMNMHWMNLERYLEHDTTVPIPEGKENYSYDAMFLVANGAGIADELYADKIIKKKPSGVIARVTSEKTFNDYLALQMAMHEDGGYVYDSDNRLMFRVPRFNSNKVNLTLPERIAAVFAPQLYDPVEIDYEAFHPQDFLSRDGTEAPSGENLGTRTQSAIDMATRYDHVHVFLIKKSAYGDSGMGKLVHLTHEGVVQEFYFKRDTEEPQRFIGVHRVYDRAEGKLQKTYTENVVTPAPQGAAVPVPQYAVAA